MVILDFCGCCGSELNYNYNLKNWKLKKYMMNIFVVLYHPNLQTFPFILKFSIISNKQNQGFGEITWDMR